MFVMQIETGGAAFAPDDGEIARILRRVAERIEEEGGDFHDVPVLDSNGNRCGAFTLEDAKAEEGA